ncbi:S-adenosyl-L-methionine-dependent methyltransferase [Wolfiporia cocos MD-104 SS10]|uniref:S-adenosyl-L-methionine-dependent methyltransferase n=1 Tax=Wolfiporia cocos (strain MD-104) TaxID=742152 RepID=A0A2H3J8H8_WOLCO|nr:S-adenosyl-L-methionine-dependent methyltransferase [Wolfiporia cocos MD-104 SS10]
MAALFQEDATDMMEYACGTGLVSRELCAYVRSIVGIDISEGMVEQFNLRARNQGLDRDEMQAFCVELKGNEEELDGRKFDLIVCSLSYHHFSSIEDITRILAFFLKPGGSLLVADIMKSTIEGDIFPGNTDVVAHQRGFSEEEMRGVFEEAGLADVTYMLATSGTSHGKPVDLFLACGVKPT